MRYITQLEGDAQAVAVDVEPQGDGRFRVTLRGQTHEVDALALPDAALSLLVDGRSYRADLAVQGDRLAVVVQGFRAHMQVADARRFRSRPALALRRTEGRQPVTSPMPGKVVRILVAQGDRVAEGQGLVVVEAMKMENELKSPKEGVVVELAAREGQAVELDAVLAVVE